jgi:hypothetical protein
MKKTIWCKGLVVMLRLSASLAWGAATNEYANDFERAEVGKLPDEFLVLDGQFAVQQEADNKFLELPGAPLETFGVLFGPSAREGQGITARVYGTGKGRRYPAIAASLGGVSGFKLQVSPAKKALEIFRGDRSVASTPYDWASGKWTHLRLQIRKVGEASWKVEGRAWLEGAPEPSDWTITLDLPEEPVNGRAGVWGKPFSETPIRFDDLKVEAAQ